MNYPKTASSNIGNGVSLFQNLAFGNSGDYTLKMDRRSGIFIREGRGKIFDRFSAVGAVRNRNRLR
jgi:hypothetical protein